jgi:enoyl-[acyl-carrier protein] reductase I
MMSKLLENKKGIIFGALDERSIAWKVAEKAFEHGASFVLTNAPIALRMGKINELAEKCGTEVIPADATSMEDLNKLVDAATERFGKLDFVLHSIGMSPNVRKDKAYTDLNHEWYLKTMDISALSFHKVLQSLYSKDAMNPWGSVLALSYIAAQEAYPFYSDMADAKAALESIARSFGYHYGVKNKVRVNTISQSPTVTSAGSGIAGFDKFFEFADKMSPLGNADAESCADYCISLFSDLTRYVTMQNLYHDGGYSTTGISSTVMENWSK